MSHDDVTQANNDRDNNEQHQHQYLNVSKNQQIAAIVVEQACRDEVQSTVKSLAEEGQRPLDSTYYSVAGMATYLRLLLSY